MRTCCPLAPPQRSWNQRGNQKHPRGLVNRACRALAPGSLIPWGGRGLRIPIRTQLPGDAATEVPHFGSHGPIPVQEELTSVWPSTKQRRRWAFRLPRMVGLFRNTYLLFLWCRKTEERAEAWEAREKGARTLHFPGPQLCARPVPRTSCSGYQPTCQSIRSTLRTPPAGQRAAVETG